jgi:hypothetical protein
MQPLEKIAALDDDLETRVTTPDKYDFDGKY